jgi:hypothetical protein
MYNHHENCFEPIHVRSVEKIIFQNPEQMEIKDRHFSERANDLISIDLSDQSAIHRSEVNSGESSQKGMNGGIGIFESYFLACIPFSEYSARDWIEVRSRESSQKRIGALEAFLTAIS